MSALPEFNHVLCISNSNIFMGLIKSYVVVYVVV